GRGPLAPGGRRALDGLPAFGGRLGSGGRGTFGGLLAAGRRVARRRGRVHHRRAEPTSQRLAPAVDPFDVAPRRLLFEERVRHLDGVLAAGEERADEEEVRRQKYEKGQPRPPRRERGRRCAGRVPAIPGLLCPRRIVGPPLRGLLCRHTRYLITIRPADAAPESPGGSSHACTRLHERISPWRWCGHRRPPEASHPGSPPLHSL